MKEKLVTENQLEEICSVSTMARKLNLSRAWFYRLVKDGIFPPPAYCLRTRRPLYPRTLQEQCLDIRRRGITASGQPVFFYHPRSNKPKARPACSNQQTQALECALQKMGLKVTQKQINRAIVSLYPEGLAKHSDLGAVVGNLFRHLSLGL